MKPYHMPLPNIPLKKTLAPTTEILIKIDEDIQLTCPSDFLFQHVASRIEQTISEWPMASDPTNQDGFGCKVPIPKAALSDLLTHLPKDYSNMIM